MDYHEDLLLDPPAFNRELIPWLLWYNGEQPHWGLELKSSVQFLMEQKPKECKMWWTNRLLQITRMISYAQGAKQKERRQLCLNTYHSTK